MGFWENQPTHTKKKLIKSDAQTQLPDDTYEWSTCSTVDLRNLLCNHYLSDETSYLEYTARFLDWQLHEDDEFNVALRKKGKLIGFISATPGTAHVKGTTERIVFINFLCLHAKHRDKGLAPLLIQEITRRAVLRGIEQAIYTASATLPGIACTATYFHRLLNPPKLIECGFLETNDPKSKYHDVRGSSHLREANENDVPRILEILRAQESTYEAYIESDETYVREKLLKTARTFIADDEDALVSLYELNSVTKAGVIKQCFAQRIVGDPKHVVIFAKNLGFDVLTVLNFGMKDADLTKNKFLEGSGRVHMYLYNWGGNIPLQRENVLLGVV